MTHESAFRSLRTSTEHLEILVGQVPKRCFSRRTLAFVISSFVVMAMFADLGSWIHGPATYLSSCIGSCQADPTEAASFLSHTAYSLLHLHNPFLTNFYNYPMGVNMMDNDFMPLIGLLAMPLTLSIGPTAAINILVVVGFASSATAAFFAFARWTSWTPAAYLGALLYGFSPFMVSQGQAHFLFLLAPIPPLVLLLLDEILVRQERRAIRSGVALGLLVSAHLLISPEIMATMVLISVIGIALLVLFHWRRLRDRLHHAARALSVAAGTAMVVSAYPLWLFLFGPEHVVGPAQPRSILDALSNDIVSVFLPSQVQRISPMSLQHIENTVAPLGTWTAENGAYIGIPLLLVLTLFAIRYWRFGIVRFASTMGLVSLVLSLGRRIPTVVATDRS